MPLLVIAGAALLLWLLSRNSGGAGAAGSTLGTLGDVGSSSASSGDLLSKVASAVAYVESGGREFNPDGSIVTSNAGALGIMQLEPSTAAMLGVDPYDPQQNFAGGETYLSQLYGQYGNWYDALAAYNWGPGNVDKALASGSPYPASVQQYIANVESNL